MDTNDFDVFVIGSGVAGRYVASTCAKAGLKVAITDHREYGGTCANRGCDSKKILLGPTEIHNMAEGFKNKGISVMPVLKWKKIQKFKRTFTDKVPAGTENKLKDLNIKLYHQSPEFIDGNRLTVEGKTVKAKKIVIATGLIPRELDLEGHEFLKTSDDFLSLKKLPKTIVFIGAGYIGMELAHMAARYGCQVTVIEYQKKPLTAFDPDLVSELVRISNNLGIDFLFETEIMAVKKLRKKFRIDYKSGSKNKSLKAHMVFNTAGRVPAIGSLLLDKGDVAYGDHGVKVNEYLQSTSNPNVYACGDVSSHSVPLTPLSGAEGKIVAINIINGNQKKIDVPVVPSVVFTLPNLASVGFSEEEAKKRYKNVLVNYKVATNWYNAKRVNASIYAYKIVINERTNEIVGAHILGPHAAETINLFAMAINQKLTAKDVKRMIFTYPSWGYDIKSMV